MTRRGDETRSRILEAIRALEAEHGYAPTQAEIAEAVGVSENCVYHQLKKMRYWGLVRVVQPKRGVRVVV